MRCVLFLSSAEEQTEVAKTFIPRGRKLRKVNVLAHRETGGNGGAVPSQSGLCTGTDVACTDCDIAKPC